MAVKKRSKPRTRRTPASRKGAARKRAAPKARASLKLHKASKTTRKTVFHDLQKVLDKHGVHGSISEIHFSPSPAAAAPPPPPGIMARGAPAPCPPNQILKVVCRRNNKGEMHCTEECRPV